MVTDELNTNPSADAAPHEGFAALGLSAPVLSAIAELGYEEPTPIQRQTIRVLMAGHDVMGQAQTGTGKTAAFAIPIVEQVDPQLRAVQALVLAPTRELAVQVAEATHRLGRQRGVTVLPIYGGQPIERQLRGLRQGVQVVVGTPGRVMDHIRRETLKLDRVRTVVLDEADEMLEMGFIEDVEFILDQVPAERQMALFSATLPPAILALGKKYMRDPRAISVSHERLTVPQTRQGYYEVPARNKLDALTRVLDMENPTSAMIFCRTKRDVDALGESLQARGYLAETIHGDLSQVQRDRVMRRFREGQAELLVATDVAARGLDIPDVTHVINYDVPDDPEAYVHRIGRTGRAGRKGEAITLVAPRERWQLRAIERTVGKKLRPLRLPTPADIAARRRELFKQSVREALEAGPPEFYLMLVEELSDDYEPLDIAAAALKLAADADRQRVEVEPVASVAGDGVGAEPGMVRLFLDIGRRQGVRPADIVGAIANEAKLPGQAIGAIDILDNFSFVEVPKDAHRRVLEALTRTTIRNQRLKPTVARPKG